MSLKFTGMKRFRAAWQAAASGEIREVPDAEPVSEQSEVSALHAKIESFKMDIQDRDRQISRMKKEYELLSQQSEANAAASGESEVIGLAKKIAPFLSQADAMKSFQRQGMEIRMDDLFKILTRIQTALSETGVQPIGSAGEDAVFDSQIHQRMSGGDVTEGSPVKIRFPGYRKDDTVLLKAMVSRKE